MAYLPSIYLTKIDAEKPTEKPIYLRRVTSFTEGNAIYRVLEPILLLLRFAGMFPYTINLSSGAELHCGWVAYSAMLGVLQCGAVYLTLKLAFSLKAKNFDEQIFSTVTAMICALQGIIPCVSWLEARWLRAYLDKWTTYQEKLRSCNVFLDTRLQKWFLIWVLLLFPFVSTLAFFVNVRGGYPLAFPLYFLLQMGSYLLLSLWFFMVLFIEDTASRLLVRLGEAGSGREVATLKKLWLTLANLIVELGQILSPCLIQFIIGCSIIGITNSYSLLFFLRDWFMGNGISSPSRKTFLITQLGFVIIAAMIIVAICECSHRCTISVGSNFLKEILKINFSLRNEYTQRELQGLVQTILLRYPDMALNGFLLVNRRLLTTMATSAITYLIVLLQFRSSGLKV